MSERSKPRLTKYLMSEINELATVLFTPSPIRSLGRRVGIEPTLAAPEARSKHLLDFGSNCKANAVLPLHYRLHVLTRRRDIQRGKFDAKFHP